MPMMMVCDKLAYIPGQLITGQRKMSENGSGDEMEVNLLDGEGLLVDFYEEGNGASVNGPAENNNNLIEVPQRSQEDDGLENNQLFDSVTGAAGNQEVGTEVFTLNIGSRDLRSEEPQPSTSRRCTENYVLPASEKYESSSDEEMQEGSGAYATRQIVNGTGLTRKEAMCDAALPQPPSMHDRSTSRNAEEAPPQRAKTKKGSVASSRKKPRKEYAVDEVIDSRRKYNADGTTSNEYCVKWSGFNDDHNSWDRESETYEKKIEEYWCKTVQGINRLNMAIKSVPDAEEPSANYFF